MSQNTHRRARLASVAAASALLIAAGTQQLSVAAATDEEGALVLEDELIADAELYAAAQEEGKVVVYTTSIENHMLALGEQFTADTGVEVEIFRAPGAELTQRVLAEADADIHEWDVIQHTNPGDARQLAEAGLLASYQVPHDHSHFLAPDEIDANFYFYPFVSYLMLIGYNNAVVDPADAPATWDDVVDPRFTGSLGIVPAGAGGTTLALGAFQLEVLGEDWLRALAAVEPVIFTTSATISDNLGRGELEAAISVEYVLGGAIDAGAPITLVYPEQGVVGGVSYSGVAETSPHPNAGRLFQNWYLSKHGQNVQASVTGPGRPVRDDAISPSFGGVPVPPASELNIWWSNLSSRIDTASETVARWNEITGYTA